MRLIDAEWLKELYQPYENYNGKELAVPIGVILANIDDAPTIEAYRPKGKWVEHKWKEYNEELMMSLPFHNYECSKCSFHAHEPTNFCPQCGADMRGK